MSPLGTSAATPQKQGGSESSIAGSTVCVTPDVKVTKLSFTLPTPTKTGNRDKDELRKAEFSCLQSVIQDLALGAGGEKEVAGYERPH